MKRIKHGDLPAVYTSEILEVLLDMAEVRDVDWREIWEKMSRAQHAQYTQAKLERAARKNNIKNQLASQAEKDAAVRGSQAIFYNRWWDGPFIEDRYAGRNYGEPELFTFFSSPKSPFSMCYPASLKIDEHVFCSAAHYVMYKKPAFLLTGSRWKQFYLRDQPRKH